MAYRITGLPAAQFRDLFQLGAEDLAARNIETVIADEKPGYPCRISLEDAEPGERLLLLSHEHQPAASPYRATGPIFLRACAVETFDRIGEIPPVLRGRLLSLRAYDKRGCMIDADVTDGAEVETLIGKMFGTNETETIHVHFARRGCYACKVVRG